MTAPLEVLEIATPFVKQFEGFVPEPEPDGKGIPTEGYGFIAADFPGGRMPASMTEPEASAMLAVKLGGPYYDPIAELNEKYKLHLNPNQLAALLSFSFNLGRGIFGPQHTIGHLLRQGNVDGAINSMTLYSDPSDPVDHEGLLRRREAEQALARKKYVPLDPNHYLWYPDQAFLLEGRKINERKTAQLIDQQVTHPHIHRRSLLKLHHDAVLLRKRIWVVSVFQPPDFKTRRPHPDWDSNDHRGMRYQLWSARVNHLEKVLA